MATTTPGPCVTELPQPPRMSASKKGNRTTVRRAIAPSKVLVKTTPQVVRLSYSRNMNGMIRTCESSATKHSVRQSPRKSILGHDHGGQRIHVLGRVEMNSFGFLQHRLRFGVWLQLTPEPGEQGTAAGNQRSRIAVLVDQGGFRRYRFQALLQSIGHGTGIPHVLDSQAFCLYFGQPVLGIKIRDFRKILR